MSALNLVAHVSFNGEFILMAWTEVGEGQSCKSMVHHRNAVRIGGSVIMSATTMMMKAESIRGWIGNDLSSQQSWLCCACLVHFVCAATEWDGHWGQRV